MPDLAKKLRAAVEKRPSQNLPNCFDQFTDIELATIHAWLMEGQELQWIRDQIINMRDLGVTTATVMSALRTFERRTLTPKERLKRVEMTATSPKQKQRVKKLHYNLDTLEKSLVDSYDPLRERVQLIATLKEEYSHWSAKARDDGEFDPNTISLLKELNEALKNTEDLAERLNLLAPRKSSPHLNINLDLIRTEVGDTDKFSNLVSGISRELESASIPMIEDRSNASKLSSEDDHPGTGDEGDLEVFEREPGQPETGPDS